MAERVPGPDTGPTNAATQAQKSNMELEGGSSIIQQDCRGSGDTVGNVVEPRFLLVVSNLAFS